MTSPTTTSGRRVVVEIETATPGTYELLCGLKERSFKRSRSTADTSVQDCGDYDVVNIERDVGAISTDISGSGVVTKDNLPTLEDWFADGEPKNLKVKIGSGTGWSTYTGAALLSEFEVTGSIDGGEKAQISVTIAGTGAWTRSTNS